MVLALKKSCNGLGLVMYCLRDDKVRHVVLFFETCL